jgi:hypothetical protein
MHTENSVDKFDNSYLQWQRSTLQYQLTGLLFIAAMFWTCHRELKLILKRYDNKPTNTGLAGRIIYGVCYHFVCENF